MEQNPPNLPELPGKLYVTDATRTLDQMIEHARAGGWGTVYNPAGAQKTFLLEYRAAEAARQFEPDIVLMGADPSLSPRSLLARIAQGPAAPWAWRVEALREAILYTARNRSAPVAVVVDEAQLLYPRIDTLETLRRLGDAAQHRMGILVAGNDQVVSLFEPRCRTYIEQWRSRIEQKEARILGPTKAEARGVLTVEIRGIRERVIEEVLAETTAQDPISRKSYVNARRLFTAIRMFQRRATK